MRIILIGPPGSGKGTQAAVAREAFKIAHISTGDILRENVRSSTALGKEAKAYMDAGSLVPDDLIMKMVAGRLRQDDAKTGFLMDGFPRTLPQAEAFDELMRSCGVVLDVAILLDVSDDDVVRRLVGRRVCSSCGAVYNVAGRRPKMEGVCDECSGRVAQRDDDTEPVIRKRLSVYHGETAPLIDYYERAGKLHRVDGTGPTDSVVSYMKSLKV
jgi:adenylate kinase